MAGQRPGRGGVGVGGGGHRVAGEGNPAAAAGRSAPRRWRGRGKEKDSTSEQRGGNQPARLALSLERLILSHHRMGNSLRCCLACVLPCGALDLIRIVHLSGRVEEYGRPVAAGEILSANPNHVLSKPCSQGVVRRILIVSPESELERGQIYFLIPASSVPAERKKKTGSAADSQGTQKTPSAANPGHGGKTRSHVRSKPPSDHGSGRDVQSEKRSLHRRRVSTGGRTVVWRPHLECIVEGT